MTPLPVTFHPEATADTAAARSWYATHGLAVADAFMREVDKAVANVAETPDRWPQFRHGTRRYLMRRFPYLIVYRVQRERIEVLAVAHAHRRPGYWETRL